MKNCQEKKLFATEILHQKYSPFIFSCFDESNEVHLKLAGLSETAHKKAVKYLQDHPPQKELTATRLGKFRLDIKKQLAEEMKEIDRLVKKVVG